MLNESYQSGGAVQAFTNSGLRPDLELNQVLFTNNTSTAGNGGAMNLSGASLDAQNLIVHANTVGGNGGGIYMDSAAYLRTRYASFVLNQSNNGGAVFVQNWSGGADLEFKNTDFSFNEGISNRDIRLPSSGLSSSNISNNNIHAGPSGSLVDTDGTTTHHDPLYLNYEETPPNLRLNPDSELYLSEIASTGDDTDPDGTQTDIGAYGGEGADNWDLDGDEFFQCWNLAECDESLYDSDDFNSDEH